jgi:hypothetical protein
VQANQVKAKKEQIKPVVIKLSVIAMKVEAIYLVALTSKETGLQSIN